MSSPDATTAAAPIPSTAPQKAGRSLNKIMEQLSKQDAKIAKLTELNAKLKQELKESKSQNSRVRRLVKTAVTAPEDAATA